MRDHARVSCGVAGYHQIGENHLVDCGVANGLAGENDIVRPSAARRKERFEVNSHRYDLNPSVRQGPGMAARVDLTTVARLNHRVGRQDQAANHSLCSSICATQGTFVVVPTGVSAASRSLAANASYGAPRNWDARSFNAAR